MPSTSTAAPRLLAQALTLPNGTVLRNRLAKAAMSETLGTYDNRPTPALVALYQRWAASGLGLIIVGLARLLAIDPDAPAALLQGRDSSQQVRAIKTGLKAVDRLGIMEVLWYERQLKRIAQGTEPRPGESGLAAFLKSALSSGWGTYRTRRLRAGN